jgi:hypothetical protein
VNRRGENPIENAPWGTFSLWLMVKNDGTSNTHEHEERPKVLKKNALVLLNARMVGKPSLTR